ncbi:MULTISPECIES: zinc ribbon domain-containing protein [Bacillus]|uniref:Zinc ribbon domain-containing protein n=2 Tax=Bacillus TaxID=1386 RepID=A0AAJ3Z2A7_9BACI|nr:MULTISPECIES: zinc ribbon domain-containing protein [Bacillus]KKB71654.1 transmembrane protein [Bacillus sp. TH008]MDU0073926.1 zinc ribbon domain-containing protein [Bacillus sp. IG6]MED8021824.1 zinc ribbon domain-containing protein [Bacillus glycinifermentans]QAT67029.1 zinc ribbon domain-containing protein [Bacillus glycinifermentans]WKB76743.1 zinc ribbon domain-containing protein [Bacillus glycinifermentans]
MTCTKCGHQTDGGKFCENCGASLSAEHDGGQPAGESVQAKQYVDATKKASSMYFSFFVRVMKRPYAETKKAGEEHMLNSIITMVIFALTVPLMFYFGLKSFYASMGTYSGIFGRTGVMPGFFDIVVKPAFTFAIYIFLLFVFTYAGVRIQGIQASFREVMGRFGAALIPFTALLLCSFLLSLLKTDLFLYLLFFAFCGIAFLIPPAVLFSYREKAAGSIDFIYTTLLVYLATFIAVRIMGNLFLEYVIDILRSLLGSLF